MALIWPLSAQASESELVDTGFVNAQLVSSHRTVAPGQNFHIALRKVIDPGWHTYWLNPGDSGEPVQIDWKLSSELTAGEIVWPLPRPIPTGPLINYGFDDLAVFPVPFEVSKNAKPGDVLTVDAEVYYLVCSDVCVPEDASLSLTVIVGPSEIHNRWNDVINIALSAAPKLGDVKGGSASGGGDVIFKFIDLPEGDFSDSYFFPYGQGVVEHSAKQKSALTDGSLELRTKAGFDWKGGTPDTVDGLLSYSVNGERTGVLVAMGSGPVPDVPVIAVDPGTTSDTSLNGPATYKAGIVGAMLAALIGGLILNIMPCVFPVISLKALSIAKSAHGERGAIRRDAWAYTFGVLASFLVLIGILLVLKAGGREIGWGFQLQDPRVVGFLALLLFAVGLNLLGVFEIRAGGLQNAGQSLTQNGGFTGSFFTGVLAVLVATPCTAPFMAGAIGWAFTQPAIATIAIFMALGFGFALPFLILAYVPALSNRLPKPGLWMVTFKEFLAFPMFGAAIWLIWVLAQQSGSLGLRNILITMLGFGFVIWLFKQKSSWTKILSAIGLIAVFAGILTLHPKSAGVHTDVWSNDKVAELRADGQAVFVDFTAAWCVSCKVNEMVVLNSQDVQQVFENTNTAFLTADWTNKNDIIARELQKYGRSGVPLYLLYPPGNNDVTPEILPQTLTKNMVIEKLQGNN